MVDLPTPPFWFAIATTLPMAILPFCLQAAPHIGGFLDAFLSNKSYYSISRRHFKRFPPFFLGQMFHVEHFLLCFFFSIGSSCIIIGSL